MFAVTKNKKIRIHTIMGTKKNKKQNRLAKAKAIVKKINNDLIDASFKVFSRDIFQED